MPLLIVMIVALAISFLFPGLARALAWLLTLAFIIPFCTFGVGSFAWAVANIFTGAAFWGWHGWWGFCAFVGFPTGLLTAWWVHTD